ncbi:MAG: glycosyltransferase, partial [Candidatus Omnitrophica bacterium]|nr:glycosyltransferase [Candidatus Omnitrophota bacterium]
TNDNPFSPLARRSMWRNFIKSINFFDIHFVFRKGNISDFYKHGAKNVFLLRPYFIPEDDFPINREEIGDDYLCDVVFAGHYEDDGRAEALEAICRAGYKLKLYGGGWNKALAKLASDSPLQALYPIQPATGRDYNKAICGAKVALCFFSTLNKDVYTRRSFQIPAMKVAMLSEHSDDLEELFASGKEAVFFSDTEELLEQTRNLLRDAEIRERIANGGYSRVHRDGHDVTSRMLEWLAHVRTYQKKLKNPLHFIQDIPTPHNNILLNALQKEPAIDLHIWYARLTHSQYSFEPELAYEAGEPVVYGYKLPSWRLIKTALFNKRDKFFVVGWMNPTTRILLPLFWLLRRPYNMWFDFPERKPASWLVKLAKEIYYFMLNTSKAKIFCVDRNTVQFFKEKGFSNYKLVNLPILVAVDKPAAEYRKQRCEIRAKYGVSEDDLFIVSGSRLVFSKGFDLLIQAISMLDEAIKPKIKLVIIGKGAEKNALIRQVETLRLTKQIFFEDWMASDDFRYYVGSSDIVVSPARFDAFGGAVLTAMAVSIPVIGSIQGGAAMERIKDGHNGWLYEAEDVSKLAALIHAAYAQKDKLLIMGIHARNTACMYAPEKGAAIICGETI